MGLDLNRLIDNTIDEELLCCICTDILTDPLMIDSCEHAFCKTCISDWFAINKSCPKDRKSFSENMLVPIPRFMKNHLNDLKVKCTFGSKKSGCPLTVTYGQLSQHENGCQYNPISSRKTVKVDGQDNCFLKRRPHIDKLVYETIGTSMNSSSQKRAVNLTKEAVSLCGRYNFGQIAAYIKTHLEPQDMNLWHCIVGNDFDCFLTANFDYISLKVNDIFIIF
ncbi:uncharacterized protein LOC128960282 [Oppia nitens]|uniref:uncharacterized protein LOC128960282 n=1 Tax=Oppia nitens TaxID=1686743 RepID=UPI0023DBB5D4|nr:uncharacterized protein LOC128960282 [Oppia nitens]